MFSLAYVILPVTDTPPSEAIRDLLPRSSGGRGDLPEGRLAFHDETGELRQAHEAHFTFSELEKGGLQIEGGADIFHLDMRKLRDEMKRLGLRRWPVRFADEMDLEAFADRFGKGLERHPDTGSFGHGRIRLASGTGGTLADASMDGSSATRKPGRDAMSPRCPRPEPRPRAAREHRERG